MRSIIIDKDRDTTSGSLIACRKSMESSVKEKCQEDVSKTGNGYHQDPEMNHGPLRGHL